MTAAWRRSPVKIGYDQAGFTTEPGPTDRGFGRDDLVAELEARAVRQRAASQVVVDHYRVGYHWAFRLPVAERPSELPDNVAELARYPWLIWLSWELEERWDTLAGAWQLLGDAEAGRLLQQELAALAGWEHFRNWRDVVGLPTGHLAGALARGLALNGWDPTLREAAVRAARTLLDGDIPSWFTEQWVADESLHNIPLIVLTRVAQLARVVGDPVADTYAARAVTAIDAWVEARRTEHHTEQSAYNGYLFDSVTDWLDGEPDAADLYARWADVLAGLCVEWVQQTVPGRVDLAVPLGDVEAEMTMWLTCLVRLLERYGPERTAGAEWLLSQAQPSRLPASALTALVARSESGADAVLPPTGVHELPTAVAVREGWAADDPAVVVGVARNAMGHLHADTGQVVLAWRGRCWITDPGYQQYRRGPERDFTTDAGAHNGPVIDGHKQTVKAGKLLGLDPVEVDLSRCYPDLPEGARVRRRVGLAGDRVTVTDVVDGVPDDTEVATHWLGGGLLAWSVVAGWVRLSDGEAAVWFTTLDDGRPALRANQVERHLGSRGPVTLRHTGGPGERRWLFVTDPTGGWDVPTLT
ncbi:heparinase II/III domain-containing protein [Microlunatus sp. Y2014]|uniref:heparinase II/III domain-containing protein n=1 Tax=Microlunatus sp. Y2014 TaxID=3418488 RepID=UPI003DA79E18